MRVFLILCGVVALFVITLHSCKKDVEDPVTPGMELVSITSDKLSLNSALASDTVGGVSTTFNIIATFSNKIDYASIRDSTVILRRDTVQYRLNFIISGKTLIIDPFVDLLTGTNFKLDLTGKIRGLNGDLFAGKIINIKTEGLGVDTPPRAGEQISYIQFNGTVLDVTFHDSTKSSNIAYAVDRFGIAGRAGSFAGVTTDNGGGSGPVAELKGNPLITPSMTFSTWINISQLSYINSDELTHAVFGMAGTNGYYFDIESDNIRGPIAIKWVTSHASGSKFVPDTLRYAGTGLSDSITYLLKDGWHQIVLTYDNSTFKKSFYIDGIQRHQTSVFANSGMATPSDTSAVALLTLGYYVDKTYIKSPPFNYESSTNTFLGQLDDFRIFKVALRPEEIATLYETERLK